MIPELYTPVTKTVYNLLYLTISAVARKKAQARMGVNHQHPLFNTCDVYGMREFGAAQPTNNFSFLHFQPSSSSPTGPQTTEVQVETYNPDDGLAIKTMTPKTEEC